MQLQEPLLVQFLKKIWKRVLFIFIVLVIIVLVSNPEFQRWMILSGLGA